MSGPDDIARKEDETPAEVNYFNMSDKDIMDLPAPVQVDLPAKDPADDTAGTVVKDPADAKEELSQSQEELDRKAAEDKAAADALLGQKDETTTNDADKLAAGEQKLGADGKPIVKEDAPKQPGTEKVPVDDKKVVAAVDQGATVKALADYSVEDKAAAFDLLMGPIRANGRDIQMQTPEEARKLMQMGAGFTRKMQALQPRLRMVTMLDNNGLDESALSFLIELHKKKPEAIQKLLSDSKFDPLTVDADKAADYVPVDHRVSDRDVAFQAVLEEVAISPTGKEFLNEISTQWDADSKQALYEDPNLLNVINAQRANGIYEQIMGEIDRRKTLGNLQGTSTVQAYYDVGLDMQTKGLLVPVGQKKEDAVQKQPIDTRVVKPPPKAVNGDKAKAASPPKSPPANGTPAEVNFLELSDAEFLKQMEGRV